MFNLKNWLAAGAAFAMTALASAASAEEGMWTFDAAPTAKINAALGTRVDQAWLDKVRAGAVRLAGCSASAVSPDGLILTNQHCVRSCVQTFSTPERDMVREGFFTKGREDERVCAGQTAEILLEIVDVTGRVTGAAAGKTGQAFVKARDAEIGAVEQEGCGGDPKMRCQVISLHRGGQYKLYKFRKYSDVRLVYAPEAQAVVFGGDPDNFNFPRYALDAAFLRAYEDGKPAKTPNHLKWNPRAPKAGEPTFVVGNPGTTARLKTLTQLETERDWMLPATIKRLSELRGRLIRYADESDDHKRQTRDALRGVENNLKRSYGMHQALATRSFMDAQRAQEADFRGKVAADAALAASTGDPWTEIAAVQDDVAALLPRYEQLESQAGGGAVLFSYARTLVRAAQERAKPNGERLLDYTDARLPLAEKRTLDARRLEPELETLYMAFWLNKTREALGTDAPTVQQMLGKESPEGLAARLVADSKLGDPAVRAALWKGGLDAIKASDDPLIQFVLKTDADARAAREAWEERVEGPTDRAGERIALAGFKVYGDAVYPDATFSPRISYGRIAGVEGEQKAPAMTTLAGLYERATGAAPFEVSAKFAERKDKLNLATVYTVSTTNDIIGGNSGSPLIDAKGEVIGAVFDGNLGSLGGAYGYDASVNRTVAVSAAMVQEALLKMYDMPQLVKELNGGK